jgi:hypothetical protein
MNTMYKGKSNRENLGWVHLTRGWVADFPPKKIRQSCRNITYL